MELSKAPTENDGTDWWEWVRFLLARTEEEVEMVARANTEIRKAADALYVLSADPNVRTEYERREMAERDEISRLESAKAKAMAMGEATGEANADRKWQGVVADKDAVIADMGTKLAGKDAALLERDAENERLRAQVAELLAKQG